MEEQSKHRGWLLYRQIPNADSSANRASVNRGSINPGSINPACGKLIQFADLSRDTAAALEIEKCLREVSLKINKTQEAQRLELGIRLHDQLGRSLGLINSNRTAFVSFPEEHVRQIRAHLSLVYPTAVRVESSQLRSAPLAGRSTALASG